MLGVSSYAYAWRRHPDVRNRWSLEQVLRDAHQLGLGLVQLCDVDELEDHDPSALDAVRATAERLGLVIETGTKGVEPEHLQRHLETAQRLGSGLIRSMLSSPRGRPDPSQAVHMLRKVMPHFERRGVVLALETYEQYLTAELVQVIHEVASPNLGICLDPGNSIAALEHPRAVVDAAAPHVKNVHIKDFTFSRSEGMIGFQLSGAPLGEGLLDYDHMIWCLTAAGIRANHVLEHWMPRSGTLEETAQKESQWVEHSVGWLLAREGAALSSSRPDWPESRAAYEVKDPATSRTGHP